MNSDSSVGSGETWKQTAASYLKSNGDNNRKTNYNDRSISSSNDDFDIDKSENGSSHHDYIDSKDSRFDGPGSTSYSVINKAALDMLNGISERSTNCSTYHNSVYADDDDNANDMKDNDDNIDDTDDENQVSFRNLSKIYT